MRWQSGRRSKNIEDRRGFRVSPRMAVGGGVGTLLLVLLVLFMGGDPSVVVQQSLPRGGGVSAPTEPYQGSATEERLADFVSVVLADTEDTWQTIFRSRGQRYEEPALVLFSGAVESACGFAQAAVGPFYCPSDRKVYLDLTFFQDLQSRFRAPGDFAQAYVIAHEIGHHVQNLLGIAGRVNELQRRVNQTQANQLSVMMELQADCLAGIWANHAQRTRQILEEGDIEEGLNAASAIGDDRLQRRAGGYVTPDSFTHGSSAQRVRWFKRGLVSGDLGQCDTFSAESF